MLRRLTAPAPRSRVTRRIALAAATLLATSPTVYFAAPASAEALPADAPGVAQQKQSRIPQFIIDAGAESGNSVESENFAIRWGDAVDVVAWGQQNGYDDYPRFVADHMEGIYDYYVDEVGFVDPADHAIGSQYKINLYLCGSWSGGFLPPANWAGLDDIGLGHMCLPYDKIWDDWVESHELNHILQAYASDLNAERGNGGGFGHGNPNAGAFWEAHANYMARFQRPDVVIGSGYFGDRHHLRWLAQETYYGDWMLINTVRDTFGAEAVDQLWFEATNNEHPIETIKRTLNLDHDAFAALIADYAARTVVYDFADGAAIRGDVFPGGSYRPVYTYPLDNLGGGQYAIPSAVAPHQYGYNLIELQPGADGQVSVQLAGATGLSGADWRFRLVAVSPDYSVRYSDVYAPGETASFGLAGGESHLLLAVAATPSEHRNYPLEPGQGDPFPYQLTIEGATPAPGSALSG